jgi:ribonuclease VapC
MIVDSSAIIAILRGEPEASSFSVAIDTAPIRRISAVSFVEAAGVSDGSRNPVLSRRFDDFVIRADLRVEPVSASQARIAREAYRDFGKGSGHPARLNFGDCFAYALAKEYNEPLLFKGSDFSQTDIMPAHG